MANKRPQLPICLYKVLADGTFKYFDRYKSQSCKRFERDTADMELAGFPWITTRTTLLGDVVINEKSTSYYAWEREQEERKRIEAIRNGMKPENYFKPF